MFNKDQENESGGIDLKYLLKLDILYLVAYVLASLDFLTTTYGISQALDLRGIKAIAMSLLLAGIFLWVVIISKDKVAPAIEKLIGDPIRNIPVRTEQRQILNVIATVIPSIIVFLFGTVFLIVDFWTSLQGVSILINFKGVLGAIIKCFAVFALVFSTAYLIYLQPKQTK